MRLPRQRDPEQALRERDRRGVHAVVLGAGMSGLLAARVLADHYDRVTLVERDELTGEGAERRGVPQGHHAHVLLPGGASALEQLLPGLLGELQALGAPTARSLSQLHLCLNGHLLSQEPDVRAPLHQPSRPLLESRVLARVRGLGNVTVLDGHDVTGLVYDVAESRVTGARLAGRRGGSADLMADLVVLATGRDGRASAWLKGMGFAAPEEDEVPVGLTYVSQHLRIDAGAVGGLRAVVVGPTRERPTAAIACAQEDDRWIVSLAGYGEQHRPPRDRRGWLAFAEQLLPPDVAAALSAAEPLSALRRHHVPANLWRRYDKLERVPGGFLVVGDAVCSLNPVHGQGMTVAALEALALRDVLRRGPNHLAARFYRAASKPIGEAWTLAVCSDLRLPRHVVPGPRSAPVRAFNAYVDRVQKAATRDPVLARRILEVTGLRQPVSALVAPDALRHLAVRPRQRRRSGVAEMARWP